MLRRNSIGLKLFHKVDILIEISKKSNNREKSKTSGGETLLLYELFEREPGWRFTARCHTEPQWIGVTLAPRRFVIMVDFFMFLMIFYIMSYWFVTFRCYILYWSLTFCEYQLPSSTKPLLTTALPPRQNVEKMMKISKNMKISIFQSKTFPFQEIYNFHFFENFIFFENIHVFNCVNN